MVFLASEYPPHTYGGLGTAVEALSRSLAAGGRDVLVCVPDAGDYATPPPGVSLLPVPVGPATADVDFWLSWCGAVADAVLASHRPVDVVHGHDWMAVPGGLALRRVLQVPVVMTVHLPQSAPSMLLMENVGLAACDGVIVNSEAVRAELAGRGVRADEISLVPNGVDLARFTPAGDDPDPARVLFVGRLVPQKGVDVLIRAFGAVLRRRPDARLVIAGDGQQRLYLERLARFLGVRDRVDFLGWQPPDRLPALYRAATVTAVPSLYEPFGLVALEAMASGRPVVVARVGGLAEIVEDGRGGFTVEPGDDLDLASRLAALLSDTSLARSVGAAARRRAEQYDWAAAAGRTARLYDSLARRRRRAGAVEPVAVIDDLVPPDGDDELRTRLRDVVGGDRAETLEVPSNELRGCDGC